MPSITGLMSFTLAGLLAFGAAQAAPPRADDGPFLRIETGVHEAVINRMALLPDQSGVVTASDDKTARIWSLDVLSSQGVLRPPIGPGDDGAVYAVAASARLIALGGRVRDADGSFAINLIQREGMRPLGNIGGFPAAIMALKFSPDFTLLAVGLADGAGLRVLNLTSLTMSLTDSSYGGGGVTWLDYDAHGDLVVAAEDGVIRRYDADHRRTVASLPKDTKPWGVAFSPDGKHIAVGDRLRPVVHLLDAARLRLERDLDGAPDRPGSFNVVAFAPDGQTLFAAGSYREPAGTRLVRRWSLVGHAATDTPVASDTITDLVPLPDSVLYATGEPSLGRINAAGAVVQQRRSRHIDFRNAGMTGFRLSADGTVIELTAGRASFVARVAGPSEAHILFDVQARQILPPDALPAKWSPPSATAGGLTVTDWLNSHTPRLNGQLLKLEPAETVHGVAVLRDGSAAVLGTDFYVRYVAGTGEVWRVATPAPAWAVNVSADGRVVVAALGDGAVHWYNAMGDELQALFVDPDTERFVLWTRDGFFDHDHRSDGKPDGRTLIGYQFNQPSRHASEFVEIGQLYKKFFRPDLVGLALRDTPDAREDIAAEYARLGSVGSVLADGLPPRVVVVDACGVAQVGAGACPAERPLDTAKPASQPGVDLATTADLLLVRYKLQGEHGKVGHSIVQRDDAVLAVTPEVAAGDDTSRTEAALIPLGSGVNVIRITPMSASGAVEATTEASAELRVAHEVAPAHVAQTTQDVQAQPPRPGVTLYLLSVGISHFVHSELNLQNADNDARAVAELMAGGNPPVYDAAVVKTLLNKDATTANLTAALGDIAAKAGPDDLVLIYFAGHGVDLDGKYYFVPADLGTADPALFRRALETNFTRGLGRSSTDALLRQEAFGQDRFLPLVQSIKASRVALILDTCYSGSLATEDAVRRRDINSTVTNTLGHAAGRFVLSSAYTEAADAAAPAAGDAGGHGLFTAFLLKALLGDADSDHTGRIDIYKLAKYTERNVKQASTGQLRVQTPSYYFAGNDFFELRAVAAAQ